MKMNSLKVGGIYHNSNGKDYKIIAVFEYAEYKNGSWAHAIMRETEGRQFVVAKNILKTSEGYARSWSNGAYTTDYNQAVRLFKNKIEDTYFTDKV